MNSNPNQIFPKNDAAAAVNFGDALHSALLKGAALSDVLALVADAKPSNFAEASVVAREFAREYASA